MTLQALQHSRQTACILRANPVQFEAIGHKQSEALLVFRHLRSQRFDPGIELLLGQLAGQLVHTGLPQGLTGIHRKFWGKSLGHVVFIFCGQFK